MATETILIHADVLLDRRAIGTLLPDVWAHVLAERHSGTLDGWRAATSQVAADWDSYWADLDLSGDDSLRQWREGRWRIVRAWFRLADQPIPGGLALFLDQLPREVGRRIDRGWYTGAIDALRTLDAAGTQIAIIEPFNPASLLQGVLDAAGFERNRVVIGPDELCQIGLEGIAWVWMARLAGGDPQRARFVSHAAVDGWPVIAAPADLRLLPDLIHGA